MIPKTLKTLASVAGLVLMNGSLFAMGKDPKLKNDAAPPASSIPAYNNPYDPKGTASAARAPVITPPRTTAPSQAAPSAGAAAYQPYGNADTQGTSGVEGTPGSPGTPSAPATSGGGAVVPADK